jgi:phage FluMu protein Com
MQVEIQCPDCGEILIFIKDHPKAMFCSKCNRILKEAEIRERCGL